MHQATLKSQSNHYFVLSALLPSVNPGTSKLFAIFQLSVTVVLMSHLCVYDSEGMQSPADSCGENRSGGQQLVVQVGSRDRKRSVLSKKHTPNCYQGLKKKITLYIYIYIFFYSEHYICKYKYILAWQWSPKGDGCGIIFPSNFCNSCEMVGLCFKCQLFFFYSF